MISCVVFDLDDTLYEEIEYCRSGFQKVARVLTERLGLGEHEALYGILWQEFDNGNHITTFNAALEKSGIIYDNKLITEMLKIYREHAPSISLPVGSETLLKELGQKYKLALLTDGYLPGQKFKVRSLEIENYFQCIVYTEELGREYWKPSTVGFEKIMKTLNVKGQDCVYIGDNAAKDFIAPNKLGFRTIQLLLPNRLHRGQAPDENAEADHVVNSISELSALLKEME